MKCLLRSLLVAIAILLHNSCGTPTVEKATVNKSNSAESSNAYSLHLSWSPQSDTNYYHVFYVDDKQKAREIDGLDTANPAFSKPAIAINDSNMDSWPAKGQKVCFYIVAENSGLMSAASDTVCEVY